MLAIFLPWLALAAAPAPDVDLLCEGSTTAAAHVSFNLIRRDHDGERYGYQALEYFLYNGQQTSPVDLNRELGYCGRGPEGERISGPQSWRLDEMLFTYELECPQGRYAFSAVCRP